MSAEARLAQIVRAALDLPGSPGERLYDYALPDGLHVGIGDGVVVPFGARRAVGIVVACDTTPPEGILVKPLESRIGEKPILSPRVMQLAQEIADYWAAPLSIT
ncbi:MAG: primosomal protein N', partial [Chloroflexota bacterium]